MSQRKILRRQEEPRPQREEGTSWSPTAVKTELTVTDHSGYPFGGQWRLATVSHREGDPGGRSSPVSPVVRIRS